MKKIVLVTGGRDYQDAERVDSTLDALLPDLIIEGGATGVDHIARVWAEKRGVHNAIVPAHWSKHGRAAGPLRNETMVMLLKALQLAGHECLVVAFPGGPGTASCIALAEKSGLSMVRVEDADGI